MAQSYTLPEPGIKIEVGNPQSGRLAIEFRAAPEKAAPGEPGKQAGDVIYSSQNGQPTAIVSLGKAGKLTSENLRQAGGGLANWLIKQNASAAQIDAGKLAGQDAPDAARAVVEGMLLGAFRFDRYKKNDGTATQPIVTLTGGDQATLRAMVDETVKLAEAVNLARDWAHEPANVINPVTLAERVTELGKEYNLRVTVINDTELRKMGAGAIVAVGQGSKTPSRLIVIEYQGKEKVDPLVVVGKAITFDTGGYSIKTVDGIQGMKYDKSGAMDVLGIVVAAAQLGLKTPVTGVIAAAENMVSGESYRPDDIIKTLWGKTVEIISTDAEGRLVLADALAYAQKNLHPSAMIDFATLTGGVVVALGHVRAGVMSNNDALVNALIQSGEETGERIWRLPLDDDYDQQIKGDDADIKNSGGREAAPVIGGIFLKQFVDPQVPWAHVDIAGTGTTSKDLPYCQKGATGFGVRLVIDYLRKTEA